MPTSRSASRSDRAVAHHAEPLLRLVVAFADGRRYEPDAYAGLRLDELMKSQELPLKAECGGAAVCATCHVRVARAWIDRLPPPGDEELSKLDEIPDACERSRLACQIVMTEALDGLEVEVAAESTLPAALPAELARA